MVKTVTKLANIKNASQRGRGTIKTKTRSRLENAQRKLQAYDDQLHGVAELFPNYAMASMDE